MKQGTGKSFADKHRDASIDPKIEAELLDKTVNGRLPCAVAFDIASRLSVAPAEVGITADLLNIKLSKCQLGLFGYQPENKVIRPDRATEGSLKEAIWEAQLDRHLSCESAWAIAARFRVGKLAVGNACEALGIKIRDCQLGAFR
jgi:hypothetical protein